MNYTISIYQGLVGSFVTTKNALNRFCLVLVFATGLLTSLPAMSAPILVLPPDFVGVFEVDYPLLDLVVDIEDGDTGTTDYFFEWTLSTRDSSNNLVSTFFSSVFENFVSLSLDSNIGYALLPAAGEYTLELNMSTFHQVGGLAECGPHSTCFDNITPFNVLNTSDTMNVQLGAVPVPPAVWLFGSGLLGLVGIARRKSHA